MIKWFIVFNSLCFPYEKVTKNLTQNQFFSFFIYCCFLDEKNSQTNYANINCIIFSSYYSKYCLLSFYGSMGDGSPWATLRWWLMLRRLNYTMVVFYKKILVLNSFWIWTMEVINGSSLIFFVPLMKKVAKRIMRILIVLFSLHIIVNIAFSVFVAELGMSLHRFYGNDWCSGEGLVLWWCLIKPSLQWNLLEFALWKRLISLL